jgi:hypothetical protein
MERLKALIAIAILAGLGVFGYYIYSINKRPAPAPAPVKPAPPPPQIAAPAPQPVPEEPKPQQPAPPAPPPVDNRLVMDPATEATVYKLAVYFVSLHSGRAKLLSVPKSAGLNGRNEICASVDVTQGRTKQRWNVNMQWTNPVWQLLVLDVEGGKTVFSFGEAHQMVTRRAPAPRFVTASELEAALKEAELAEAKKIEGRKKQRETEAKAMVRTWTDSTGKHSIEAEFRGMVDGKVKLRKMDGSEINLPLEKLSDADQKWVRSPTKKKVSEADETETAGSDQAPPAESAASPPAKEEPSAGPPTPEPTVPTQPVSTQPAPPPSP